MVLLCAGMSVMLQRGHLQDTEPHFMATPGPMDAVCMVSHGSLSLPNLGTVPTNATGSSTCSVYFWLFSPIVHIALYQSNTFGFLNLAWSRIPAMEGKPVSVLTQRCRLRLFDDSVETGCSQRRQPQATEVGPAGQWTRTGPPRFRSRG